MEEKKKRALTPARMEAVEKYKRKAYDVHNLRIRKDGKSGITMQDIKAAASSSGESVNAFIIRAITRAITEQRPGLPPAPGACYTQSPGADNA